MKTSYYHGTNADNLPHILKHGLQCYESKLWTVSEDAIYLWHPESCGKANDLDPEYWESEAFRLANESGQIACSIAKDCRVVVLKIELDDELVSGDTSCENMESGGAKCIYDNIPVEAITEIHVSNDLSLVKGYFMSLISKRRYCNIDFTPFEQQVAKMFEGGYLIDHLDDYIEFEKLAVATA